MDGNRMFQVDIGINLFISQCLAGLERAHPLVICFLEGGKQIR
jgi:hypothetical protein